MDSPSLQFPPVAQSPPHLDPADDLGGNFLRPAALTFVEDKTKSNGNDDAFEIIKEGRKAELCFTQVGLFPAIECYGGLSLGAGFKPLKHAAKPGKPQ
jgi:hypothetical protein